jgi:ribosomal protein S20
LLNESSCILTRIIPCIQGSTKNSTVNHISSLKPARQTEARTKVNRANGCWVRTSLRTLRKAIAKGDVKAVQL